MNIFVLDKDYKKAAKYLSDIHVPKMILESAQILCSAFDKGIAPYKRTHYNHPCCVWVRESKGNFLWLIKYAKELAKEFEKRFKKQHKSLLVVLWCEENINLVSFPKQRRTAFALAMPSEYISNDPVESYRKYYFHEKGLISKWRLEKPSWWSDYK